MGAKPLTKQEAASQKKKEQIFKTAMELFDEYGYEQTTIRQICAATHTTTGSFYNFFKDKLGLLRQLHVNIRDAANHILQPTEEALSHPFQSIFDYLVKTTSLYGGFRKDVAQQIVADSARIMTGGYDSPYEETSQNLICCFLKRAQKFGSVPAELNPEKTTIYLMAVSMGCTNYWILRSRNMPLEEAASLILIPAFSAITTEKIIYRGIL